MKKVELIIEPIIFEFNSNGELLFCCVGKADYERYGLKCPLLLEVVKGVSDDELEAQQDYLVQVALAMNLGAEHQERRYH
jgi:hypothetical protein